MNGKAGYRRFEDFQLIPGILPGIFFGKFKKCHALKCKQAKEEVRK